MSRLVMVILAGLLALSGCTSESDSPAADATATVTATVTSPLARAPSEQRSTTFVWSRVDLAGFDPIAVSYRDPTGDVFEVPLSATENTPLGHATGPDVIGGKALFQNTYFDIKAELVRRASPGIHDVEGVIRMTGSSTAWPEYKFKAKGTPSGTVPVEIFRPGDGRRLNCDPPAYFDGPRHATATYGTNGPSRDVISVRIPTACFGEGAMTPRVGMTIHHRADGTDRFDDVFSSWPHSPTRHALTPRVPPRGQFKSR